MDTPAAARDPFPDEAVRSGGPPYLSIQAVQVFVRNQERSVRFYLDQLGFTLAFDAQLHSGDRWVAVAPPDGTTVLALIQPKPDSPEYKLIGRRTNVAFVTENVLAKFEEWRRRGVRFSQTPRLRRVKYRAAAEPAAEGGAAHASAWGGVFTRFKDPDGNTFTLMGFDDMTRQIEARRRAAAERIEAERRAAHELAIAKQVQERLFPRNLPALETLEYAGVCVPARAVGGDYYDFLDLGRGRLGLVIGDISGKGIAAALLMANLQANLRSLCAIAPHDREHFLRLVNRLFCDNTTDSAYATLFFGEYDDRERRLSFANCGHLSGLLLRRDDSLERLDATSTVMGLFRDWDCAIDERRLDPGDTLALYTDGITESFNEGGEEFGEARLIEALRRFRHLPPREAIPLIVDEARRFGAGEQGDDVTMILAHCKAG
ncbi:MAG TPA: SpoIIE family protein phosphatase [Bryobacteraceae bacterium]|nr:SpoIIE family protein phosphatase [Bryobacteraceae bacterium]